MQIQRFAFSIKSSTNSFKTDSRGSYAVRQFACRTSVAQVGVFLLVLIILSFPVAAMLPASEAHTTIRANAAVSTSTAAIDFENLPGGGGTAEEMIINNQYASLGVTFPNHVIRADSAVARSGSKFLITASLTEFNAAPLVVRFTSPQKRVKLWAGQTQIQHFAQRAILRAFDAESGGSQLGEDKKDLPSEPVGAKGRADVAMEVSLTNSSIRRVELLYVRASDELSASTFEAIDDLEFETDTIGPPPPPACGTSQSPVVSLTSPSGGQILQTNEFLLQGSVSTEAPLQEFRVTVTGANRSGSIDLLVRGAISVNGGSFGLNVNDMLSEGNNTITVAARNCKGPGETNRVVTFSPEVAPPRVTPLIFIPGVAGSNLYDLGNVYTDDGANLWIGHWFTDHRLLTLDPSKPQEIIGATDVLRSEFIDLPGPINTSKVVYEPLLNRLTQVEGYREYQINEILSRRTEAGCDLTQASQNPNLFVFAYDWRKDNAENAEKLRDYIGCIKRFYPASKVDILAHSMGGLIARRYILDNLTSHNVGKLITMGTPWLGAPKIINTLHTGQFVEGFGHSIIVQDQTVKDLLEFFPGAHQLLPSPDYFRLGGRPMREDGWDLNHSFPSNEEYTFDQMRTVLDRLYPRSRPGTAGLDFHTYPGQDDWTSDNSGVQYYHIVGIQKYAWTIGQIRVKQKTSCSFFGLGSCKRTFVYDLGYTYGDGTVPQISAQRFNVVGSELVDINHPDARLIQFFQTFQTNGDVSHGGMVNNPDIQDELMTVLNTTNRPIRGSGVAALRASPQPQASPSRYLTITGASSVTVTDGSGNSVYPLNDPPGEPLPGMQANKLGEQAVIISLAADQSFAVTFLTGVDPMSVEIVEGVTNDAPTRAIRYPDLNLGANTNAGLMITPDLIGILRADSDGDGALDMDVQPTVTVQGTAALDVEGPSLRFHATTLPNSVSVSIAAQDAGSGMKRVLYSLDGTHFLPYEGAVTFNRNEHPIIYAIADDNVANRSSVEHQLVPFERPSDITAIAAPNTCSLAVQYTEPNVTIPGASIHCAPPSGSTFPVGTTSVTCEYEDPAGNTGACTFTIRVNDTQAPRITEAQVSHPVLWPPNNQMVDVVVRYNVMDNCQPESGLQSSLSITSNEGTDADWQIIDAHHVRLRAKRNGNGSGRVYRITITCADSNGNSSAQTVTVTVPKNMGQGTNQ
jgi:pimeloyl-ACP methyl ester carboxylesterase